MAATVAGPSAAAAGAAATAAVSCGVSKHFACWWLNDQTPALFLFFFLQHWWFKLLPVLGAESLDAQKNASQSTIKLDIEQALELNKEV
jgi:hypothetical protein